MEYNFRDIEKKWQQIWKERNTYRVENGGSKPKYYALDMFPYPSGAGLHVGHPLGYIASDIVSRYKRLCGYNVLHPMGFDSFGLPAEQYAIQTGQHPEKTTKENIARYIDQMNKIGFSFDWSREVWTSNPDYYKWTQWIFLQIFGSWYNNKTKKAESIDTLISIFEKEGFSGSDDRILTGDIEHDLKPFTAEQWKNFSEKEKSDVLMNFRLAYLGEAWVNWCPQLGTVLANDEVKDGVSERGGYPVERKRMPQWSMRITSYADRLLNDLDGLDWTESMKEAQRNWIGRSEGTSLRFKIENSKFDIEVFTTRPDTVFGVTFVTLAPEHELIAQITTAEQKKIVDEYVTMAKNRSERERMADVKKVTGAFTGAYVIHPFTNEKIPVWTGDYVLAGYGTGAVMGVPAHDSRDYAFAKHFEKELEHELGYYPIIKVIQPNDVKLQGEPCFDTYDGKCINSDFLDGLSVKDAIRKAVAEIEKKNIGKGKVNYRLRDAAFGRQRYWGEPIPIYYENGIPKPVDVESVLAEKIKLPEIEKFLPTETGEPPLARAEKWFWNPGKKELVTSKDGFALETTTMPGWAGSSWYFLRYMVQDVKYIKPENDKAFVDRKSADYWKNVDLYIGGTEHATGHLLYIRFWTKFLFDREFISVNEPAQKLINQGMIQGVAQYHYEIRVKADIKAKFDSIDKELHVIKNNVVIKKFEIKGKIQDELPGYAIYCSYGTHKRLEFKFYDPVTEKYIETTVSKGLSSASCIKEITINSELIPVHVLKEAWLKYEQHYRPIVITDVPVEAYWHYEDNTYDKAGSKDVWKSLDEKSIVLNTDKISPVWVSEPSVEKMSKSKLNVVTPDDQVYRPTAERDKNAVGRYAPESESKFIVKGIVEQYGADTLRMYEMFLGPLEQSKPWNTNGISGVHGFLKRFWRMFENLSNENPSEAELKVLHRTLKKIKDDIDRFSFNTCVSQFMICVNELMELKCSKRGILEPLVIALSPFAPHIAEELWEQLGNKTSVTIAEFPTVNEKYLVDDSFNYPVQINGKVRFNFSAALTLSNADIEKEILSSEEAKKWLEGKTPKKVIVVPKRIVNIVI